MTREDTERTFTKYLAYVDVTRYMCNWTATANLVALWASVEGPKI